jgi:hypothetical protein
VAVLREPGLQAGVGVAQAIVGAEVPGADHGPARQLAGGDPTLPDGTGGHRDRDADLDTLSTGWGWRCCTWVSLALGSWGVAMTGTSCTRCRGLLPVGQDGFRSPSACRIAVE